MNNRGLARAAARFDVAPARVDISLARAPARVDISLARAPARVDRHTFTLLALGTVLWLAGFVPGHGPATDTRFMRWTTQLGPTRAAAQEVSASAPSAELPPAPPAPPPEPVVPVAAAAPTPPPTPVQTVRTTQDAALLSPPPPPGTHIARNDTRGAAPREPVMPKEKLRDEDSDEAARDPMNWLGLTVRLGYAAVASGTLNNPTYNKSLATYAATLPREQLEATGLVGGGACTPIDPKCHTAARSGFQLALALNIGGSGLGFDLEPYITVGGNAFAVGAYVGPRIQLHLARPFYLGIGFGARAAYVKLDGWKDGGDIFGRIPVSLTYYVVKNFALVLEGSFGAGVSLFVSEPVNIIDPRNNKPLASAPKIAVGAARGWDITLGLRFP